MIRRLITFASKTGHVTYSQSHPTMHKLHGHNWATKNNAERIYYVYSLPQNYFSTYLNHLQMLRNICFNFHYLPCFYTIRRYLGNRDPITYIEGQVFASALGSSRFPIYLLCLSSTTFVNTSFNDCQWLLNGVMVGTRLIISLLIDRNSQTFV